MEQRPLRLGDIVDDYCPRERRVTNHAVVAIVEDAIRQTRCTTCDAEHVYKAGKSPRRRNKDGPASLYEQVLADVAPPPARVSPAAADSAPDGESNSDDETAAASAAPASADDEAGSADSGPAEAWVSHRRLIRATLPRTDGEPPPPRPIPEFTMHQRQPARGGWSGNGNSRSGHRPGRNGSGFGFGNGPDRSGDSDHRRKNKRPR